MNKQREVVYGFRNEIITSTDVRDRLMDIMEEVVIQKVDEFTSIETGADEWNIRGLSDWVNLTFPLGVSEEKLVKLADSASEMPVAGSTYEGLSAGQFALCTFISDGVRKAYELKISFENPDALKSVERYIILSAVDKLWQEHLYNMDGLRTAISLRAYGQKDPLIEYKAEAYQIFQDLMVNIKTEICRNIFQSASSIMAFEQFLRSLPQQTHHDDTSAIGEAQQQQQKASDVVSEATSELSKAKPIRTGPKVGRNDPCPCGSGKKYKQCCGKL
jgi:preprotein translocase subunit SecA